MRNSPKQRSNRRRLESQSKIILSIFFVFALSVLIFPNGWRDQKLFLLFVLIIPMMKHIPRLNKELVYVYTGGALVSLVYYAVGISRTSDPTAVTYQVIAVYLLGPFFWLLFSSFILDSFKLRKIVLVVLIAALGIIFLQFLVYFLWAAESSELATQIVDGDDTRFNANFSNERLGATLHAFGSLIFIVPALFGLLTRDKSLTVGVILVFCLLGVAASGREYLIVSAILGVLFYVAVNVFERGSGKRFLIIFFLIAAAAAGILFVFDLFDLDLISVVRNFYEKIVSGGGLIRRYQYERLVSAINDSYLLGAGHGVAVENIRLFKNRDWSYEVLVLATIHRVGAIGTLIYALPLIISMYRYVQLVREKTTIAYDHFFMFGMMSFSMALFTNPYMESVEFQWAFFLPYVYILKRSQTYGKRNLDTI